jgi:hypothetical protein
LKTQCQKPQKPSGFQWFFNPVGLSIPVEPDRRKSLI